MIETEPELARFVSLAREAKVIAIDTEFVGEGRYRTLLCLIQLAVPGPATGGQAREMLIELIDPLSGTLDLSPLATLLADPEIEIVMHAGRQDVALLRRELETEISNLFDTQLAAGFTGLPAQRSYEALLGELLGVRLAKSASFTRWEMRPLTAEQVRYAREDVVHLIALADAIKDRLARLGRLQWALQECEIVARSTDQRDLESVFAKLPRVASASATAQALAHQLVHWREVTAQRQDRPVQSVLADAALMEIAKRRPRSVAELSKIRGVQHSVINRCGKQIVELLAGAGTSPPEQALTGQRGTPADPMDAPIVALLEALARTRAREADLAYELITSRADLQAIVAAKRLGEPEPSVRALSGWRRELLGQELLALIEGELSLSVSDGELQVQSRRQGTLAGGTADLTPQL